MRSFRSATVSSSEFAPGRLPHDVFTGSTAASRSFVARRRILGKARLTSHTPFRVYVWVRSRALEISSQRSWKALSVRSSRDRGLGKLTSNESTIVPGRADITATRSESRTASWIEWVTSKVVAGPLAPHARHRQGFARDLVQERVRSRNLRATRWYWLTRDGHTPRNRSRVHNCALVYLFDSRAQTRTLCIERGSASCLPQAAGLGEVAR